jgi:hypothetical protein
MDLLEIFGSVSMARILDLLQILSQMIPVDSWYCHEVTASDTI